MRLSRTSVALTGAFVLVAGAAVASEARALREKVRTHRVANEEAILREFAALLAIPNLASDGPNIRRNAEHIRGLLERRGVAARLLEVDGSPPAVYGELPSPGATRTVLFYVHYDGQPVDRTRWSGDPWTPVLRDGPLEDGGSERPLARPAGGYGAEWRLYARSTSDDKAPIVGLTTALDALRAAGVQPSVHLKFFFEGEEEAGSPHMEAMLDRHKELLAADAWILCDGPVHQTRRMQVYFGARGNTDLELTVYGPSRSLHSGHYGNWAPNPAVVLADLLLSLRDADGRIRIAGVHDDVRPLTAAERQALADVPDVDEDLRRSFKLAATEAGGARLVERILAPALNVRGIESGRVGAAAANAIPTEATVSIDFRLVPDQTPAKVRDRVEAFLRQEGWHVVHGVPDAETRRAHVPRLVRLEWGAGYPPARTALDLPVSRAVVAVLEESSGAPLVRMPSLGGSIPMYLFSEKLGVPVVGVPIANHDNNQHAANENIRLQNLWDGIETYAALIAGLGGALR